MHKTIDDFLKECKDQTSDRIYEIFESEIDDSTYIHIMSHVTDDMDSEPVRNALNNLGRMHNIQSLVDY